MNIIEKILDNKILDNMRNDHINESSAECSYYVILSFIPFLILLLTLIQYTNIEPQQLFETISNVIPETMKEMMLGIIREVYSKSLGTISISLIFILFSADRAVFALSKELHFIYKFDDSKNKSIIYLKIVSLLQTILFIILITLGLGIMVFGKPVIATIKDHANILQNYTIFSEIITTIILFVILFLILVLMYKFIARKRMKIKEQIRGALFASIAINIVSFVFSKYLEIFRGFSTTYGSLTALMLVMMWTYSCFYMIFIGAEINKFYYIKKLEISNYDIKEYSRQN